MPAPLTLSIKVATAALVALAFILAACPHALALGGTALGWGDNEVGQTGDGAVSESGCECVKTPKPVKGLSEVTQVAGGESGGLAVLANGTVMAWGGNEYGQLGNGSHGETPSPVPAPVPGLSGVIEVASGEDHNMALLVNGTVMAWGRNDDGELGLGALTGPKSCEHVECSDVPVQVPGLAGVVEIDAMWSESMALLANGTVLDWGEDAFGEDGTGAEGTAPCDCLDSPTPIPGLNAVMEFSAGKHGGMALLPDGTVRDWGYDAEGQVGNGQVTESPGCGCLAVSSPFGVAGARSVAAGGSFNSVLLSNGTAEAWGEDSFGELGNGTFLRSGCHCVPTPGSVTGLVSPTAIAAGDAHALALLADGSVDSWGWNETGELGDGTDVEKVLPAPVKGVAGASGVAASEEDSYAVIGPSQSLGVSLAGAGSGTVGGAEILCPPSCTDRYPQGQVEILRAEPSSDFAGFSGACTGTGSCQVAMTADQSVTATFGVPKGTKIAKATVNAKKRSAKFTFSAPGAITGFQCELIKPRPKRAKASAKKGKPKKPKFAGCPSAKPYKHLKPGRYTFKVRALDILGADATPAVRHFAIKGRKRR